MVASLRHGLHPRHPADTRACRTSSQTVEGGRPMRNRGTILAFVLMSVCAYQTVRAADHIDGPRASADPSADITDVFTWMTPDASKVIIAIDLTRNATTDSRFSDAVVYATRTTSRSAFGGTAAAQIDVSCTFNVAQEVQCWVGDDAYVAGDA